MSNIHLAIAADFTLAEKLLEALANQDLGIKIFQPLSLSRLVKSRIYALGQKQSHNMR